VVTKRINDRARGSAGDAIRNAAVQALLHLFTPIANFALEAGLSAKEVKSIYEITTVRFLANRQLKEGRRHNISGIAATTGLSRSEISRIIKMRDVMPRQVANRGQQPTHRVLAAWCSDLDYANSEGHPASLKLFGHRESFNSLVREYGRGVPTRAMLDELVRAGAIELIGSNIVRLKAQHATNCNWSPNSIREFGVKSADFLSAMLSNARDSTGHRIVFSLRRSIASTEELKALRREIAAWSRSLSTRTKDTSPHNEPRRSRKDSRRKGYLANLSVTYFDKAEVESGNTRAALPRRRNLRRSV
jgi:hypothetical protein